MSSVVTCVSLSREDHEFITENGYSPTKLLRLQIQKLKERGN